MKKVSEVVQGEIHQAFNVLAGSGTPPEAIVAMCARHASGLLEVADDHPEWFVEDPRTKAPSPNREAVAFFAAMLRDDIRHEVARFSNDTAKLVLQRAAAMIHEQLKAQGHHAGTAVSNEFLAACKALGF